VAATRPRPPCTIRGEPCPPFRRSYCSDACARKSRRGKKTDSQYLEGLARQMARAGARVENADLEDFARLVRAQEALDSAILRAVRGLRGNGFTWADLGEATGTTGQAAGQKWGELGFLARQVAKREASA